jgi:hypothetical protein
MASSFPVRGYEGVYIRRSPAAKRSQPFRAMLRLRLGISMSTARNCHSELLKIESGKTTGENSSPAGGPTHR